MFERYCEASRRTLFFARYETTRLGGVAIETEHILLGLLREKKGLTRTIFERAQLTYTHVHKEIEARGIGEQESTSVEIPFSAETKRVLQYTAEEADLLGHTTIGTEHLLLGLLREQGSVAASILSRHGLTLWHAREAIPQLLKEGSAPSWGPEATGTGPHEQIDVVKHQVQQLVARCRRAGARSRRPHSQ